MVGSQPKLGILRNNEGYVKVFPISGEDLSSIPILDPKRYRKLPVKTMVEYMILDRIKNRKLTRVIRIERIDPQGYDIGKMEKATLVSKKINSLVEKLAGNIEELSKFESCFNIVKNFLEEGEYGQAYNFSKISSDYCSKKIWSNPPESERKFYSAFYSELKKITKSILKIADLENLSE